jgi:hypothetical protein
MSRINLGKVLLGGLVAGLVINIGEFILNLVIVAEKFAAAMQRLGLPAETTGPQIAIYVLVGFIAGIFAVWLYAGVRPRYGPGPSTAVLVGLIVWALYYALPWMTLVAAGIFPLDLAFTCILWGLVETVLATVAGAKIYTE